MKNVSVKVYAQFFIHNDVKHMRLQKCRPGFKIGIAVRLAAPCCHADYHVKGFL